MADTIIDLRSKGPERRVELPLQRPGGLRERHHPGESPKGILTALCTKVDDGVRAHGEQAVNSTKRGPFALEMELLVTRLK